MVWRSLFRVVAGNVTACEMLLLDITFPEGREPVLVILFLFVQHLQHDTRMLPSQIILEIKHVTHCYNILSIALYLQQ